MGFIKLELLLLEFLRKKRTNNFKFPKEENDLKDLFTLCGALGFDFIKIEFSPPRNLCVINV